MALPTVKVKFDVDIKEAQANAERLKQKLRDIPQSAGVASGQTNKFSNSLRNLSNVSGRTRSQLQNVSFQLQDIIVQIQGGQGVTRALSQQLPQLAGGFGVVGAAIGVVAGLSIPALAMAFNALGGSVTTTEDALESLAESTEELRNTNALAAPALAASSAYDVLIDKIKAAREEAQSAATSDLLKSLGLGASQLAGFDIEQRLGTGFFGTGGAQAADELGVKSLQQAVFLRQRIVDIAKAEGTEQARLLSGLEETLKLRGIEVKGLDGIIVQLADKLGVEKLLNETIVAQLKNAEKIPIEIIRAREEAEAAGSTYDEIVLKFESMAVAAERVPDAILRAREAVEQAGATYDEVLPQNKRKRTTGGTGVSAVDPSEAQLETLIESLKTEQEVVEQFRVDGLALLMSANETELEALGGFNEAKLRLEEEYQERLRGIKSSADQSNLQMTLGAGANLLGALGQFNDKALKASKVAGIAQALIATYTGAAEALKLPYPANLSAMAQVLATGLSQVASIKGVSSSGGGGGGGGGASAAAAAPVAAQTPLDVRLSGLGTSDMISGNQLSGLFDRLQDEAGDRGLNISFAT